MMANKTNKRLRELEKQQAEHATALKQKDIYLEEALEVQAMSPQKLRQPKRNRTSSVLSLLRRLASGSITRRVQGACY